MFVERLKLLRGKKGDSQAALAKHMGVTQQAIAKWETDKATPDPDTLIKLSQYFGVTVDYLIGRTDYPGLYTFEKEELTIEDAVEDKFFIDFMKRHFSSMQLMIESIDPDMARQAKYLSNTFDKFSKNEQVELLRKGYASVNRLMAGDFELVRKEKTLIEELQLDTLKKKKKENLPQKEQQAFGN